MSDALLSNPYAPLSGRVAWRTADGCVLVLRVGARPGFGVGTSSLRAVRPWRYRERRRQAALGRMLAGARRIGRLRRRASDRTRVRIWPGGQAGIGILNALFPSIHQESSPALAGRMVVRLTVSR